MFTSDRIRRIIQQYSARLLGTRLNISAWRHIAIAIANRFLKERFGDEIGDEYNEDDDDADDSIYDLQTGHGTRIAGMIYARELEQGAFGTAARRDKFRMVSRQWHRFFGFGAGDRSAVSTGQKRTRDVFNNTRKEARFRRFTRL